MNEPLEAQLRVIESREQRRQRADAAKRWRELARRQSVVGKQAHDARIVALMLAHNVTHLLTLNSADFARYPEITTITPSESLSR